MNEVDALERSAAGRALAALRPVIEGNCAVCGSAFSGVKAGRLPRMYCSRTCGVRAWREQRCRERQERGELRAATREATSREARTESAQEGNGG